MRTANLKTAPVETLVQEWLKLRARVYGASRNKMIREAQANRMEKIERELIGRGVREIALPGTCDYQGGEVKVALSA